MPADLYSIATKQFRRVTLSRRFIRFLAARSGFKLWYGHCCSASQMDRPSVLRISGLGLALWLASIGAAQAASLTLAWDPSSTATGYIVFWGTQPGSYVNSLDVGNQTTQQITGLQNGTAYYFVVRAYDGAGTCKFQYVLPRNIIYRSTCRHFSSCL